MGKTKEFFGISDAERSRYVDEESNEASLVSSMDEWEPESAEANGVDVAEDAPGNPKGVKGLEVSPSDRLKSDLLASEPAHTSPPLRQQATMQEIEDAFFEASYDTKVEIRKERIYVGRY